MTLRYAVIGAFLAFGACIGLAHQARAMPVPHMQLAGTADTHGTQSSRLHKVRRCHRQDQTHYDNELAETSPHFHAGLSCRAIHAGEDKPPIKAHCHRQSEIHYHGEMGRSRWHQHAKSDCGPFLVDPVVSPTAKTCVDRGRKRICR